MPALLVNTTNPEGRTAVHSYQDLLVASLPGTQHQPMLWLGDA